METRPDILEIPQPTAGITDRIRYLIRLTRHTQASFARLLGVDAARLSRVLSGKNAPSEGLLNAIVVNLNVSKRWLTDGHDVPFPRSSGTEPSPALPKGAPVYDIDVTAGSTPLSRMFTQERIIGYCDLPGVDPQFPLVRVAGDSMSPRIAPGSYISVRNINNISTISWGQIYVVVLEDYRLVKYIRRHPDPAMVTLHSDNPDYDDMEIRRDEIVALFLVESILSYEQVC